MRMVKWLFGFLAGLGIGWTIGTLLAPAEGEEIRGSLRHKFDSVLDEGRRAANERRAELEAQFQSATRSRPVFTMRADKADVA